MTATERKLGQCSFCSSVFVTLLDWTVINLIFKEPTWQFKYTLPSNLSRDNRSFRSNGNGLSLELEGKICKRFCRNPWLEWKGNLESICIYCTLPYYRPLKATLTKTVLPGVFFFQICVLIESHQVKRKEAWQNAGFSSNKTTHYRIKDAGMLFIRKTELEKGYREHNLTINLLFTRYMKKQKWKKQLLLILQKIRNVPFLSWEL